MGYGKPPYRVSQVKREIRGPETRVSGFASGSGTADSPARPTERDMMDAGLGWSEIIALWNEMMNAPDVPAEVWWAKLRAYRPLH